MSTTTVVCIVFFETWQVFDSLIHIFDNQLVILHYRCTLWRNRVVITIFKIFITNERYTLLIGTITVSDDEVCPSTVEVSFTQAALFHFAQSSRSFLVQQTVNHPVGTSHSRIHTAEHVSQRRLIAGIVQGSQSIVTTGTTPYYVTSTTLFPEQLTSVATFLMESFIQAIDGINCLLVVCKILGSRSIAFRLYIQEVAT